MLEATLTKAKGGGAETHLRRLLKSWVRHLRGEKSDATIRAYTYAVAGLSDFLESAGMPTDPAWVTSEHIDAYLDFESERNSPETARLRRTYLSVFFNWLIEEDEAKVNAVKRSKLPAVTEKPNDELTEKAWVALLATVKGASVWQRRDAAILRVLSSSGLRRTEVASLTIGQVDLDGLIIERVKVKGNRLESAPIDPDTAKAIDRYLRARRDGWTENSALWISRQGGGLSPEGIAEVVRRRGREAGLRVHPHMFRHRWAGRLKARGVSLEELKMLGRWRDDRAVARYDRGNAKARAIAKYRDVWKD